MGLGSGRIQWSTQLTIAEKQISPDEERSDGRGSGGRHGHEVGQLVQSVPVFSFLHLRLSTSSWKDSSLYIKPGVFQYHQSDIAPTTCYITNTARTSPFSTTLHDGRHI